MKNLDEESKKRIEWLTLFLIVGCTLFWFIAGSLYQTEYWFVSLSVMPFLATFHSSLQHETIHGHPTPWPWLNELLVSLPLAVFFPFRRYKTLHLKHHNDSNLTDPYEDPESYFWPLTKYSKMPWVLKKIFAINNTFMGRLILGPLLTIVGFSRTEIKRLIQHETGVLNAWCLHVIGLFLLYVIIAYVFQMQIWVYALCIMYPAMSLTSMRAYAEHQAAENIGYRTAIVETNVLFSLLYLNNNLHIVHHANPSAAWYILPRLYKERRKQFLASNGNTLFKGYAEITRRFAFSIKQSVEHPFLRRD